jgi:hypothetical protein
VGVYFTVLLILLILVTKVRIRAAVSVIVIFAVAFLVVLFAYLHCWDRIMSWFGNQTPYLDLGFYLFFSTAVLLLWFLTVFVFDRLSFWRVRPGQITHEYIVGAVDRSYDTDNMVFTKRQGDLFRHLILGLGSGDLHIQTMGGMGVVEVAPNVLFASARVTQIQRLIATKPDISAEA